ncbi:hypothetical protein DL89DRAFT_267852 [Linderina pennispora]|uniref:RRM domain-containing protein n=1 Tax=Linderina pennispora TaxID=61395 RepID=A0A1Y1W825_9FUNG|nr:uncharacterized protein DL89DRAFT_267852 [Linderina pennispora]ORX69669.1 hypothetical protein DL89DRAFT_267852 [Linderina pennispora]
MNPNLNVALDDIITEDRRAHRQRRHHDASPYRRTEGRPQAYNRQSSLRKDGSSRRDDGKWGHDEFHRGQGGSINDRLGPNKTVVRQDASRGARKGRGKSEKAPGHIDRGVAITGRGRDPAPYDTFRMLWVEHLPRNYEEDEIRDLFRNTGKVEAVRMAKDSKGRFLGKAEVLYTLPEDARSAIQSFDGEVLYSTDITQVEPLRVTYSDLTKSLYLDEIKFENSLPAPNYVPVGNRLGGVPVATANMMQVQMQMQMQMQGLQEGDSMRRGAGSGQRRGLSTQNRRSQQSNQSSRPTTQQLDADLDSYMSSKSGQKTTQETPAVTPAAPAHAPALEATQTTEAAVDDDDL